MWPVKSLLKRELTEAVNAAFHYHADLPVKQELLETGRITNEAQQKNILQAETCLITQRCEPITK